MNLRILGKTIRVSKKDWNQIKERFNPGNATISFNEKYFEIKISCPLCDKYLHVHNLTFRCCLCPFNKFKIPKSLNTEGCVTFLMKQFEYNRIPVNIRDNRVWWLRINDVTVRSWLFNVKKSLERIEKRRKK